QRARTAATLAENDAAAAAGAATMAEKEAATARGAATQAEQDAGDAAKLAESAEAYAKSAEEAAANADGYAKEADEAAERVQEYIRELERKAREEAARNAVPSDSSPLSEEELEALEEAGISLEEYEEIRRLSQQDLIDYLVENGAQILVDLLFEDIKACIDDPDIPTCLWAVITSLPWSKGAKLVGKIPEITKAIAGIGKFLEKSAAARKRLKKAEEIVEKVRKKIPDCLGGSKKKKKPGKGLKAASSASATADDGDEECFAVETVLYRSPATGKQASERYGLNPANHSASNPTAYLSNLPEGAAQYCGNGHDYGFHRFVLKPGFRKVFGDDEHELPNSNKFPGLTEWRIDKAKFPEFNSYIDHSRTEWWWCERGHFYPPAG
ncbi:hypothetical protein G3I29_17965, partial [Streptomyces halstedii]|nr:hypothetical protein [Streptomyces halstedii]